MEPKIIMEEVVVKRPENLGPQEAIGFPGVGLGCVGTVGAGCAGGRGVGCGVGCSGGACGVIC